MVYELQLQQRSGWEARYREDFIAQNMAKLNRALAKHIDDNMSASDIKVNIGGDGAEVIAIVDGKVFIPIVKKPASIDVDEPIVTNKEG
jgi:hypothetical protein